MECKFDDGYLLAPCALVLLVILIRLLFVDNVVDSVVSVLIVKF